jgi:nucleoside-diphosphate-sugar epimerase
VDKLILGCGYLGRRVLPLWLARGHRVFATTRSPAHAEELRRLGAEPVVCEVLDPDSLRLARADTVLYCVGFDRAAGASLRDVYVRGLANVLDRLPPPGRLLHVSSTSVYGQDGGGEVDETAATEPQDESGRVVLEAEEVLRARLPAAVVLRFAGIYGPGRLLRRRQALEAGEPFLGDPERWLNLIHVEDGAAAVLAAEARARPGEVYNVCDDRPVRRRDFYALLAELLGAPPPRFVPGPAERANRRISNRRLREELRGKLHYPNCTEGLPASIHEVGP